MSSKVQAWFIYGLAGEDERIRYVGYTTNPEERLKQHIRKSRKVPKYPVNFWIKGLLKTGYSPNMRILQAGIGEGWQDVEKRWIAELGLGRLLNVTPGGDSPLIPLESRKKAGEKLRGRKFTDEHRANISKGKMGVERKDREVLVDRCHKMAERNLGRKMQLSPEEREARKQRGIISAKSLKRFTDLTESEQAERRKKAQEQMKGVWAGMSKDQRKARGKAISEKRRGQKLKITEADRRRRAKQCRENGERAKGKKLNLSEEERARRRDSAKMLAGRAKPWSDLTEEEKSVRRKAASERMKKQWEGMSEEERKARLRGLSLGQKRNQGKANEG